MNASDLHNYQRACVEHIVRHRFCGVFLDMGLGKTVSTLTAIEQLMYDYFEIDSVLVVAPKRVAETVWEEEGAKWEHLRHLSFSKIVGSASQRAKAADRQADIHVVSRDNLEWLYKYFEGNPPYDMVVLDELSSFKSHKSKRFKYAKAIRPYLKRLVGLTGTPAPNGLTDLWAQIYLIDRGERLGKTITSYRQTFFRPDKTNGHIVYSYKPLQGSGERIKELLSDVCMSMSAKDYLSLPEAVSNVISLRLPDDIMARYREFEREKVMELYQGDNPDGSVTALNAAALSNKLLQFANGAVYDEDGSPHELHDTKLDALEDIVEASAGKPLLVAWSYKFDRDRIMKRFADCKPRELKTAADIADWNSGKISMLLAHPASAGHGLNLQAGGSTVVWFGLTWSLELYQQFNARLHRQGQKECVVIHHLVAAGTHDEDVMAAIGRKSVTQDSLMQSLKAKMDKYSKMP